MTAPEDLTWDIALVDGGARRPSLEDCGGADVENDDPPPDETSELTALKCNQWSRQIAAMGRMLPSAGVGIRFNAGVPVIYQATGPGEQVVAEDFFTVVDVLTGHTEIRWDEGTLPIPILPPVVSRNTMSAGSEAAEYIVESDVIVGVSVMTWDGTNTLADHDFILTIY